MKVSSVSSNRNVSDIVVHGLLGINNGVSMFFDINSVKVQFRYPVSTVFLIPFRKVVTMHGHLIIIFVIGNTDG